jgi:hypothetical protein
MKKMLIQIVLTYEMLTLHRKIIYKNCLQKCHLILILRPTVEEARAWSESFEKLMQSTSN